tara:strand:- start:66 stop:323 length:258 start_codon:yes stop_codon:yes gene_type:complete
MCSTFKLAKDVIDRLVASKEPFTLQQISTEIRNANGVHRVAAGVTTQDYLDILEEEDKIVYDFSTMKYFNVSTLEEKREERLASI